MEIIKKNETHLRTTNDGKAFDLRIHHWVDKIQPGDQIRFSNFVYRCDCTGFVWHDYRELFYWVR